MLRPGGRLVYAVCSLEPAEGEAVVADLLETTPSMARSPIAAAECAGLDAHLNAQGELRVLPCPIGARLRSGALTHLKTQAGLWGC